MFDFIFDGLATLLSWFYALVPNYAVAIALLTVAVMLLLFPLNAKSQRSMAGMAKLQPELKRIQQKYKDDKQRQTEETMALFKEHNVTPIGGCLPLLVQAPVLFIMYRILIGLTSRGEGGRFDPKYLDENSALYEALHGSREMVSFGIDLAKNASEAAQQSFVGALPFFVLIALTVATGYYQQRQVSRRNPQSPDNDNPIAKQMQTMTKIFPLMYLVFGFTLPAGVVVYFVVSNVFRIGQQALIYKLDPSLLPGSGEKTRSAPGKDVPREATAEEVPAPKPAAAGPAGGDGQRRAPKPQNRKKSKKKRR